MVKLALLYGFIISMILGISITVTEIFWPNVYAHDYPKEIQEQAKLKPMTKGQKIGAAIFTTVTYIAVIVVIVFAVNKQFAGVVQFKQLYEYIWIICMFFNTFDLLVLDWLLFNTITPKCICLPGTVKCKAYRNYWFNFVGFLKGIVISSVIALIISVVIYMIL